MTTETISYGKRPKVLRQPHVRSPRAEIRLAVAHDGRWMWALSYQAPNGSGFNFAPLPQLGKFAADRDAAVAAAVDEFLGVLDAAAERPPAEILTWLRSHQVTRQPPQLELFAWDHLDHTT